MWQGDLPAMWQGNIKVTLSDLQPPLVIAIVNENMPPDETSAQIILTDNLRYRNAVQKPVAIKLERLGQSLKIEMRTVWQQKVEGTSI